MSVAFPSNFFFFFPVKKRKRKPGKCVFYFNAVLAELQTFPYIGCPALNALKQYELCSPLSGI